MDSQNSAKKKSRRRKLGWLGISLLIVLAAAVVFAVVMLVKWFDFGNIRRGEWEGNYLYAGNGRSKTTGEDYETLVDFVSIDGTEHAVTDCYGSYFYGDEALLFLKTDAPGKNICLVRYDLKTERSQFLFAEDERFFSLTEEDFEHYENGFWYLNLLDGKVHTFLDEAIVLRFQPPLDTETDTAFIYRVVDYAGNVLEELDDAFFSLPYDCDASGENFLFFEKDGGLYYRTWTDASPRLLLTAGQLQNRDADVVCDGGRFYIQTCPRDTWGDVGYSLYYRDVGQPQTQTVFEADFENSFAAEWISYNGLYLTYRTYGVAALDDGEPYFTYFNKNCVTYRYDEKSGDSELLRQLPASNSYSFLLSNKEYLEFYCRTPEEIETGDFDTQTKLVNLSTGEVLDEAPWRDEASPEAIAARGIVCGDYAYAVTHKIEELFYPFHVRTLYSFMRLDQRTGETEIMQYMRLSASPLNISKQGKYCKETENIFSNDRMLDKRGRFSVCTIRKE